MFYILAGGVATAVDILHTVISTWQGYCHSLAEAEHVLFNFTLLRSFIHSFIAIFNRKGLTHTVALP